MKTVLALFALALVTVSSAFADDVADAKKAFATLVEYQKTDDPRSPDLFAKDCAITFLVNDAGKQNVMNVPTEAFLEEIKKQLALKKGSTETYEDVQYAPENGGVRVNAKIHYAKSGHTGPFSVLYRRDATGTLRIQEFKVAVFADE